jgi:hypothetical protein
MGDASGIGGALRPLRRRPQYQRCADAVAPTPLRRSPQYQRCADAVAA